MKIKLLLLALLLNVCQSVFAESSAAIKEMADTSVHEYRLYPGDLLEVNVYDHPDLTCQVRIPVSGNVTIPLIGSVTKIVNQRAEEFAQTISERLEDGYIREAVVTLTVIEFGQRRVYVMGSVEESGAVELNPFGQLTALQAIGEAAGFTDNANRETAMVLRMQNGELQVLSIPNDEDPLAVQSDILLLPDDIVMVPRLDRVYIIGEVKLPGAVNIPSQEILTVSKAISLAGGFEKFANDTRVQILRSGEPIKEVNVHAILTGRDKEGDVRLKPGDTVFVPESRF